MVACLREYILLIENNKDGCHLLIPSSLVSVGVMDENNLESPILSWQDPRPHNTPLDSLGLTALGAGAFFKYRDGRASGLKLEWKLEVFPGVTTMASS